MSEMVERVALAIAARLEGSGCDCSRDFVRMDVARDLATLAIAAMREPTDPMIEAGAVYADDNGGRGGVLDAARAGWIDMIDEALR